MVRQTSIDCYNQIIKDKSLSKMRLRVLEAIMNTAPCTSGEAFASMIRTRTDMISQSRARVTELAERGVVKEVGKRACKISGKQAIVWEMTDMLPQEPVKVLDSRPKNMLKCMEYIADVMEKKGLKSFTLEQVYNIINDIKSKR